MKNKSMTTVLSVIILGVALIVGVALFNRKQTRFKQSVDT